MTKLDELYAEVDRDPSRADSWWSLANLLSREGRHAEAAKAWQRVGELPAAHHRGPALYNAGNEYLASGEPERALEQYDRAAT